MSYTSPEALKPEHDLEAFNCSNPPLNDWLRRRALRNQHEGASRTYVVCYGRQQVIAYYSLAVGSVCHSDVAGKVKRNMPDPIPVIILARLAVAVHHQGKKIGQSLVKDALLRTLQAAEIAGIRAILAHVVDDLAKKFYEEKCGFSPSPVNPLMLMIRLIDVRKNLKPTN